MGREPIRYKYRGGYITVEQAALRAGVTKQAIRYRLQQNGGDIELAMHGGKMKGEDEAVAEAKILEALGEGDDERAEPEPAVVESTGERLARKVVQPPRPEPQDYAGLDRIAEADEKRQLRCINAGINALEKLKTCAALAEYSRQLFAEIESITEELMHARAVVYSKLIDWEGLAR